MVSAIRFEYKLTGNGYIYVRPKKKAACNEGVPEVAFLFDKQEVEAMLRVLEPQPEEGWKPLAR